VESESNNVTGPADEGRGPLPFVTVVMPVRNEGGFIEMSLAAVQGQDYPADLIEIFVADGRSDDGTRERILQAAERDPRVQLIDNPGRIVSTGINCALARARGSIVIRIDGHCEIAPDYVSRCVQHLEDSDVQGVGGPIETIGETPWARAIAAAMSSKFGVGDSAFRTMRDATMLADTIPFPAYRKEALDRGGPFDEELVRNQDDEYNYRLRKAGAKILLAADVRSRYFSRSSVRSVWRQYFQYGFYKVRVLQKHPRQMQLRQFVPAAFVAGLAVSLAFSPVSQLARLAFGLLAGSYALASLTAATLVAAERSWSMAPRLPIVFAAVHVGYGAGFLAGLVKFANRWQEQAA
jgi:glycosyltransferase involved in cell wall biosynthesis